MIRRPPRSTLFPSTPLFRSRPRRCFRKRTGCLRVDRSGDGTHARPRVAGGNVTRPNRRGGRQSRELPRSEEHTSELQSPDHLVCRLLLEKKKLVSVTWMYSF